MTDRSAATRRPTRPSLVRVGALALAGVLSGCSTASPTIVPSPSAVPPSPAPSAALLTWSRVGPTFGPGSITAAIRRASGELVAIFQSDQLGPEVLTSADGRTWQLQRTSGLKPTRAGRVIVLNGLTEGTDGRLVLVGAEALADLSAGDAASWTSSDGIAWHRSSPSLELHDAVMRAVVDTPYGYVAVGADGFPGVGEQLPGLRGPAIWRSLDRQTWTRLPEPPSSMPRQLNGIIRIPGGLLIWGDAGPIGTGAIWTDDGVSWTAAQAPAGGTWGPINRVLATGNGYVAVGLWTPAGGTDEEDAGIWTSPNGQTWIDHTVSGGSPTAPLSDVAALGGRLVAVGIVARVAWSLDGGASWSWLPQDLGLAWDASPRVVLAVDGGLAVFGLVDAGATELPAIWFAQPTR